MTMFDLALPRRVLFGPGRAAELADLLPGLGRRVLLCTGRDPSRHRDLLGGAEPVAVVPVVQEPTVDEVRTGIALANAKLGAVHGLAGVIGGMVDAPHGAVCATLLAPVVEVNLQALRERDANAPALRRYADVARLLTGRDDATIEDGVSWLRETVAAMNVPALDAVGLRPTGFAEVAAKAARSSSMQGNPVPLSEDELIAVLERS